MTKKRYLTRSAVFLIVQDWEGAYLFQQRSNSGYYDGHYDTAVSGHVEEGETALQAMIRETKEEIGLSLTPSDLSFSGVNHRKSNDQVYYDFFFYLPINQVQKDTIKIADPDKISQIIWWKKSQFSSLIIPYIRQMIDNHEKGIYYQETGWDTIYSG